MKAPPVLGMLRQHQIQVWAEGGQLRCNAPVGALTAELRDQLRQHKQEILQFLHSAGALTRQQRAIVPLQPRGHRPPVFAVAGHNGDVFCFRALAQHLGEEQPFYGLQPPGLDGHREPLTTIEELAGYFAAEIRSFYPAGPFVIAGYCAGGTPAFELARQLIQEGAAITSLVLFGAPFPTSYRLLPELRRRLVCQVGRVTRHARALAALPAGERRRYIADRLNRRRIGPGWAWAIPFVAADGNVDRKVHTPQGSAQPSASAVRTGSWWRSSSASDPEVRTPAPDPVVVQREKVGRATLAAIRRYVPRRFAGHLDLLLPCAEWARSDSKPLHWRSLADHTEEYFGPKGCETDIMLRDPYASTFADLFRYCRSKEAP